MNLRPFIPTTWRHPFRLGRKPKEFRASTPCFGDFHDRATTWPDVPPTGWEYAKPLGGLQMLGNDVIGDCAPVALYHLIQAMTANTDQPVYGTRDQAVRLYSAVTGYDPNAQLDVNGNNPTDQGTVLQDLLAFVVKNGLLVTDSTGKEITIEILGFASLDISSQAQMRYACRMLGGIDLGIELPQSAMDDTSNWLFVPGSPAIGGHSVNQPGEGSAGVHIQTWGMNVPATQEFIFKTLSEAYAIFTKSWLNKTGKAPSGLDLDGLLAAFKLIGGN